MNYIPLKLTSALGVLLIGLASCNGKQVTPCNADEDQCLCNPNSEICKYLNEISNKRTNSFLDLTRRSISYQAIQPESSNISIETLGLKLANAVDELNSFRQNDEFQFSFKVEISENVKKDFQDLSSEIEQTLERLLSPNQQTDQILTLVRVFVDYSSKDTSDLQVKFIDSEGTFIAENELLHSFTIQVIKNDNIWIEIEVPQAQNLAEGEGINEILEEFGLEELDIGDKDQIRKEAETVFLELEEYADNPGSNPQNLVNQNIRDTGNRLRYAVMTRPVLESELRGNPQNELPATGVIFDEANQFCIDLMPNERSELVNLHAFEWALRSNKLAIHPILSSEMVRITNPEDSIENSLIDLKRDDFEFTTKAKMLLFDKATKKYTMANQSYLQADIGFRCAYLVSGE